MSVILGTLKLFCASPRPSTRSKRGVANAAGAAPNAARRREIAAAVLRMNERRSKAHAARSHAARAPRAIGAATSCCNHSLPLRCHCVAGARRQAHSGAAPVAPHRDASLRPSARAARQTLLPRRRPAPRRRRCGRPRWQRRRSPARPMRAWPVARNRSSAARERRPPAPSPRKKSSTTTRSATGSSSRARRSGSHGSSGDTAACVAHAGRAQRRERVDAQRDAGRVRSRAGAARARRRS